MAAKKRAPTVPDGARDYVRGLERARESVQRAESLDDALAEIERECFDARLTFGLPSEAAELRAKLAAAEAEVSRYGSAKAGEP